MARVWRRSRTHAGRLIRKARQELNITQSEMARRVGYSQQHVNFIESGAYRLPISSVDEFALVLNIDETALMRAALNDLMPDSGWEVVKKAGVPVK